jgi:hypothetical protein
MSRIRRVVGWTGLASTPRSDMQYNPSHPGSRRTSCFQRAWSSICARAQRSADRVPFGAPGQVEAGTTRRARTCRHRGQWCEVRDVLAWVAVRASSRQTLALAGLLPLGSRASTVGADAVDLAVDHAEEEFPGGGATATRLPTVEWRRRPAVLSSLIPLTFVSCG